MIERIIYSIIRAGIDACVADPEIVKDILCRVGGLETEEVEKVAALFQSEPPDVVHGYARVDNKFPLYAITLGGDSQTRSFLGDEGGFDPDTEEDEYAAITSLTYNLMVYAQNPDVVLYLYQILKAILTAGIPTLKGEPAFLFDIQFSGADMAPDPAWVPAGLFVRRVTLSASREYTQPIPSSKLGRVHSVAGIHIDARGAVGQDVGGVQTRVYPVGPGEDVEEE